MYKPGKVTSIRLALQSSFAIVRNGKPFTDGKYAKKLMHDVANQRFENFSDKNKIIKRIKDMSLSAKTVNDRTIRLANQMEKHN